MPSRLSTLNLIHRSATGTVQPPLPLIHCQCSQSAYHELKKTYVASKKKNHLTSRVGVYFFPYLPNFYPDSKKKTPPRRKKNKRKQKRARKTKTSALNNLLIVSWEIVFGILPQASYPCSFGIRLSPPFEKLCRKLLIMKLPYVMRNLWTHIIPRCDLFSCNLQLSPQSSPLNSCFALSPPPSFVIFSESVLWKKNN